MHRHLRRVLLSAVIGLTVMVFGGLTAHAETIIPDSAVKYGDHYYQIFYDLDTYDGDAEKKAIQLCKKRGGHLAVVDDEVENNNIWRLLNDAGIEYHVFLEIEPMFAELQGYSVNYSEDGKAFNDYYTGDMKNGFTYVCEWESGKPISDYDLDYGRELVGSKTREYNGSQYMLFPNGLTHTEAAQFCSRIGGHLVSISDKKEEDFVISMIKSDNSRSMYWIGAHYDGNRGTWVDPDGTGSAYFNWSSTEPNNYLNGANFTVINRSVSDYDEYKWVAEHDEYGDLSDVEEHAASFGFICEWELICGGEKYFHGNGEVKVQNEPSCIAEGTRVRVCEDCGEVLASSSIAVEPHKYQEVNLFKWIRIPGLQVNECTVCGDRSCVISWGKIWFLPVFAILTVVATAAFISSYVDYRRDVGTGAPPVWALFIALGLIASTGAVIYFVFIR